MWVLSTCARRRLTRCKGIQAHSVIKSGENRQNRDELVFFVKVRAKLWTYYDKVCDTGNFLNTGSGEKPFGKKVGLSKLCENKTWSSASNSSFAWFLFSLASVLKGNIGENL